METSTEKPSAAAAEQGEPTEQQTHTPPPDGHVDESQTLSGRPLRDVGGDDDGASKPALEGPDAVRASAQAAPERLRRAPQVQSAAMDWMLSSDPTDAEAETKTLRVNIGSSENPQWVDWVIRPVDMATMRSIRRRATNTREARRTGQIDEYRINLQVVAVGTLDPSITTAARELAEAGRGSGDPVELLQQKFKSKPGYVAQIAAEIMQISGFDDDDIREEEGVEAGKD